MNKEQGFLLLITGIAGIVSFAILLPLLEFVLLAVILAYILHPVNVRITPYLGDRLAPLVVIVGGSVVLVIPLLYVAWVLFHELQTIAETGLDLELSMVEAWLTSVTGREVDLERVAVELGTELLQVLFGDVADVVSTLVFVGIGLSVAVFVLYYLLRDGRAFVDWLIETTPVDNRVCRRLTNQIDRTTYGVIVGHLFVALVEGVLGGVGFWIAGIPNVFFWAFVMAIASLLPIAGPFLVWVPAVGYLLLVNKPAAAVFLFLWGAIVISLVDNYARPIVVDRKAHLNPAIILIGVFGGIYAIGATGLFIGPIVLGVLVAAVKVFDENWDQLGT